MHHSNFSILPTKIIITCPKNVYYLIEYFTSNYSCVTNLGSYSCW